MNARGLGHYLLATNCADLFLVPVIAPIPDAVAAAVPDRQAGPVPDRVQLGGWIAGRMESNVQNRLAKLDPARLLEGYRQRPSRQTWDGEHVGKWLHAATLAWVHAGDPALRAKLDYVATELCKCQLPDGYLGTYLEKDRWTEWDVWAHKYNLIGLLTYMRYTGNLEPRDTCRRMADLLCQTFGDQPGQRDIIKAGNHVGLAPTSVLGPMVWLYRFTGEPRYLDFCRYLVRAWEQPNGPHLISVLLGGQGVNKVGNGKAYEMLSCLDGALELYRVTGDRRLLVAALNGWQDIVDHRLYITGTASYHECFHDDFDLPNSNNVGETCVTVTWLQFNAQLLRLTGEARFADQLEHTILNQLLGAQRPDGSAWGYYVQMEGVKPYSDVLYGHCCLSSGPRGLALIPTFATAVDADGVVVNLYAPTRSRLELRDGTQVSLTLDTQYPTEGRIALSIDPSKPHDFTVKLRLPPWCTRASLTVGGEAAEMRKGVDGYVALHRRWQSGDQITLALQLEPRVIVGDHGNAGRIALAYGPLILAADEALMDSPGTRLAIVAAAEVKLSTLAVAPEPAPDQWKTWSGARLFRAHMVARRTTAPHEAEKSLEIRLLPFADVGLTGSRYRVWLPVLGGTNFNLSVIGHGEQSRRGPESASFTDGNPRSVARTNDGAAATEDWFGVRFDAPLMVRRIVFHHGETRPDGGWFDATRGRPRVELRRAAGTEWEIAGEFSDYPATTATDPAELAAWKSFSFTLRLPAPVCVGAARVIGAPACGNNPRQSCASCGELEVYGD